MASLTHTTRTLLRTTPRSSSLAVRALSTSAAKHQTPTSSFDSPFRGMANDAASKVPDFSHYRSKSNTNTNLLFQYFMVGTMGALTAAGAKATVQDFLVNMSASADVLAMAKVEVDLSAIPEGKNVIVKWRGKPVFIRHRTADEIKEAENVKVETLRDPQKDEDRVKKPEWLVMVGVCTHLGCVPIGEAGDYGGWFCPCHGSHYDISGRIRRGPAPLNLEIPEYDFADENALVIG
ncbi:putative cytochrome b-c1 complex subunit Rieske, mitochondrial [Cadophora sp. MPI-SDFR-AT-0126]|nr:putative cytochrome b-c1 complex subunit Rieske, mitochondrial [Leotiomycetes sp. MPI-SDFR-AT-0126]